MPATYEFDSQTACVIVRFTGLLTLEKLLALSGNVTTALSENNSERLLLDLRGAMVMLSVNDFYTLAQHKSLIPKGFENLSCAFVVQASAHGKFQFYEVAAGKQNQRVKCFLEVSLAKKWLRENPQITVR